MRHIRTDKLSRQGRFFRPFNLQVRKIGSQVPESPRQPFCHREAHPATQFQNRRFFRKTFFNPGEPGPHFLGVGAFSPIVPIIEGNPVVTKSNDLFRIGGPSFSGERFHVFTGFLEVSLLNRAVGSGSSSAYPQMPWAFSQVSRERGGYISFWERRVKNCVRWCLATDLVSGRASTWIRISRKGRKIPRISPAWSSWEGLRVFPSKRILPISQSLLPAIRVLTIPISFK